MRHDLATATAQAAIGHERNGRQATGDLFRAILIKNGCCPNCGNTIEPNGSRLCAECGPSVLPIGNVAELEDVV
jgi:hypothetical protein